MKGAKIMDDKKSEIWTDIVAAFQGILIFLKILGIPSLGGKDSPTHIPTGLDGNRLCPRKNNIGEDCPPLP